MYRYICMYDYNLKTYNMILKQGVLSLEKNSLKIVVWGWGTWLPFLPTLTNPYCLQGPPQGHLLCEMILCLLAEFVSFVAPQQPRDACPMMYVALYRHDLHTCPHTGARTLAAHSLWQSTCEG